MRTDQCLSLFFAFSLPGGGALTFYEPKPNGGSWKANFNASGAAAELATLTMESSHGRLMAMGAKRDEAREIAPAAGISFLDADGQEVRSMGCSYRGDETNVDASLNLVRKPAAILVRWCERKMERKFALHLRGIPLP